MNIKIMSADKMSVVQCTLNGTECELLYSFMHEMVDGDGDGNHQMEKLCITFCRKKIFGYHNLPNFFAALSLFSSFQSKMCNKKNLHACVHVALLQRRICDVSACACV